MPMRTRRNTIVGDARIHSLVILVLTGLLLNGVWADPVVQPDEAVGDLLDLSIEDLMNLVVESPATLTRTKARLVPAAVTTVTQDEIRQSGARSLYDLLEIYVPGVQKIGRTWESSGIGHRGLYSDRDDKYLLLVNGRILNNRMHFGALSELDLPMLRDIHHIDIVRGPGSALYGPGAVSMVVNIITDTAETFDGVETTIRDGIIEDYVSGEIKWGHAFADGDGGLLLYASVADMRGAAPDKAPFIMATDLPADSTPASWYDPNWGWPYPNPVLNAEGTPAGEGIGGNVVGRDNASFRGLAPLKIHLQWTRGGWDVWARYTRGGRQRVTNPGPWTHEPLGWGDWSPSDAPSGTSYQQVTLQTQYEGSLSERTSLTAMLSYDLFDLERINNTFIANASREDEYFGRLMLKHDLREDLQVAVGVEGSYEQFGLNSPGYPTLAYAADELFSGDVAPRWDMLTSSLVGEAQWTVTPTWSVFAGGRVDYTKYTKAMVSPRLSLVHSRGDRDTIKVMAARSVRAPFAAEMRYQETLDGSDSDPEELDSLEIRHERQHSDALSFAESWYWYDIDLITWDSSSSRSVQVGTLRLWGLELEARYRTRRTTWSLAHSFTQFDSLDLKPGRSSDLSAHLYGYGRHLSSWSDHATKVRAHTQWTDQWASDASVQVYWGYPGARDYQQYTQDNGGVNMQEDWRKTFRASVFLNLGLEYSPRPDLTVRLDGYNLMGLFNKDFNKRNYGAESYYRNQAAALGLSVICRTR